MPKKNEKMISAAESKTELTITEKVELIKELFFSVEIEGKTLFTNKLSFTEYRNNVVKVLYNNKALKADSFRNDPVAFKGYKASIDDLYMAFDRYNEYVIMNANSELITNAKEHAYSMMKIVYDLLNVGLIKDEQYKVDARMFDLLARCVGKFKYDKVEGQTSWNASKTSSTFRKEFERLLAWNIECGTISTAYSKRMERKARGKA